MSIWLPLLFTSAFGNFEELQNENRKPASLPEFSFTITNLKAFPASFEAYFKDHFGFRNFFVYCYNLIKVFCLKSSPLSWVEIGKDGWFFPSDNNCLADYRGLDPYSNEQLQFLQGLWESRKKWLSRQGILYYLVVAPDKQTIYPEFMPDHLNRVHPESRLDQLIHYLSSNSDFELLDIRKPLLELKKKEQIYYKTDTHWNFKGGYACYRILMSLLSENFQLPEIIKDPFEPYLLTSIGGDIPKALLLQNWFKEEYPVLCPAAIQCAQDEEFPLPDPFCQLSFKKTCPQGTLRAIVFRDSYFSLVEPFFSEHCNPAVYIWKREPFPLNYDHNLLKKLISEIRPQVVIEERVERTMKRIPKINEEELFDYSEPVFLVNEIGNKNIIRTHQVSFREGHQGIWFRSEGGDPQIYISGIPFSENTNYLVSRIDITSQEPTNIQVFWSSRENGGFSEAKSVRRTLGKGRSTIFFRIPSKGFSRNLRLDPGNGIGDFILHSLEIREPIGFPK